MKKKIVIYGGGTVERIDGHFALCSPFKGATAKKLGDMFRARFGDTIDVEVRLTKYADPASRIISNDDLKCDIEAVTADPTTKIVVMSAAVCNYSPAGDIETEYGGAAAASLGLKLAPKIIHDIRQTRKDIFLVGFKSEEFALRTQHMDNLYTSGLNLCKRASCNLVFANDTGTRRHMIITPEEARYGEHMTRDEALRELVDMTFHRSHLTFTRSTVVGHDPVGWDDKRIPLALKQVVQWCINAGAYKPFNGVTTGHFACKLDDQTFITSMRRTNFNRIMETGMVLIRTDGPDSVMAYGGKPSVGGQSQRIIFKDHPGFDCIVHFHCPKLSGSTVNTVSQREFECGSHECGQNTSGGLTDVADDIKAVFLDNHGPNIVFKSSTDPARVIEHIEANYDLAAKTGGYVS